MRSEFLPALGKIVLPLSLASRFVFRQVRRCFWYALRPLTRSPEETRIIVNLEEINNMRRQSILPSKTILINPALNTSNQVK